jgi:hypothetical protein
MPTLLSRKKKRNKTHLANSPLIYEVEHNISLERKRLYTMFASHIS